MKKSNLLRLLWAVLVVMLLPVGNSFGQEAYAVLKDSILTFYYTNNPPVDAFFIAKGDLYTNIPWKKCVKKAVFDDSFKNYYPSSCYCWFYSCKELSEIIGMKENLNTSNVTDMSYMFLDCYNLRNLDLSGFNTNIVLYMTSMFRNCRSLKYLDLNSFNTENVTQMSYMFSNCYNLRTIIVEDSWNTNQITSSSSTQMFYACPILCGGKGSLCKIEGVNDVTYAKVDEGEDSPGYFTKAGDQPFMPVEAYAVLKDSTLTLYYGKNTLDNAFIVERDMTYGIFTSWKAGVKKVIFDSSFDDYIPTKCSNWFDGCYNLIDIIGMKDYLHTENVTDMKDMFRNCYNLTTLDLSGFNTKKVTSMSGMFSDCNKLQTIFVGDKWTNAALSLGNDNQTQSLFYHNSRLRGGMGTSFNIDRMGMEYARIDGGTDNPGFFTKAGDAVFVPEKEAYAIYKDNTLTFYYGKNSFDDYISVEPPEWSYNYVGSYINLKQPLFWKRDSITKVVFDKSFKEYRPTSCQGWFELCYNLSEIIGMRDNLNTENVTNMSCMFAHCPKLKEIDISGFNQKM